MAKDGAGQASPAELDTCVSREIVQALNVVVHEEIDIRSEDKSLLLRNSGWGSRRHHRHPSVRRPVHVALRLSGSFLVVSTMRR